MKYLSVCSGIEAASVAWHPLGWECVGVSEIEKFPNAVLAHRWPDLHNYGDLTKSEDWNVPKFDVLVGGTPCQGFSVAGKRGGLDDPRSQLAWRFLDLARNHRPRWVLWENVSGALSSNEGADFGAILGGLAERGYGFAYRILDAQYYGVAQRRRRVFVVGYLGDWRPPAAVLFERESMSGNPAPSREPGEETSRSVAHCIRGGGPGTERVGDTRGQDNVVAHTVKAYGGNNTAGPIDVATASNASPSRRYDFESETLIAFDCKQSGADASPVSPPLRALNADKSHANAGGQIAIAHSICLGSDPIHARERAMPQTTRNGDPGVVQKGTTVRRLTPRECERLQGFPDDYTLIPYGKSPDGPRYKALGNSMAVPVMRWLGERIAMVDAP